MFEQALKNDPVLAKYALGKIQELYMLERQADEENMNKEQRETLRKEKSYPLILDFEKWLDNTYTKVLPKSQIGKAIAYTYNIYPRLGRYVLDGRYKIDNNGAENGIRPLAVGRKNYLFCGNHEAARRTAIIYSLLGTCKMYQVNPLEWLTDVFNKIQDTKYSQLNQLLPDQWCKKEEE